MTLAELISETKVFVSRNYGIRNLSLIEKWHLKECCQRTGELIAVQWRQFGYSDAGLEVIPDPRAEAAWEFVEKIGDLDSQVMRDAQGFFHVASPYNKIVQIRRIRAHHPPHEEVMIGRSDRTRSVEL